MLLEDAYSYFLRCTQANGVERDGRWRESVTRANSTYYLGMSVEFKFGRGQGYQIQAMQNKLLYCYQ